jgi:hypothetical protein
MQVTMMNNLLMKGEIAFTTRKTCGCVKIKYESLWSEAGSACGFAKHTSACGFAKRTFPNTFGIPLLFLTKGKGGFENGEYRNL